MSAHDRETPDGATGREVAPQPDVETPAGAPRETPRRTRLEIAEAASPDAICKNCGRPKSDRHGKAGYSCLPTQGVKRGAMFEPEG